MEVQTIVKIQNDAPDCYFFVYKGKRYPFKFDFFKNASQYFYDNKKELKRSKVIPLLEEEEKSDFTIPESAIEQFINYVHCQSIPLNSSNITFLSFLAKKYKVSSLIDATNEFLEKNHIQLALQILLTRQNQPQIETSTYENIISNHFDRYIKDERIFQLNLSILYRIVHKFLNGIEQNDSKSEKIDIIGFLFKCLDKYGRDASVLFKEIDIGEVSSEILDRLINNYSEIFDFQYINSNFVKKLYETQNELLKNQIKQEKEMKLIKDSLNQMRSEFQQKQEENKKKEEENRNLMNEEISKMKSDFQKKEENDTKSMKSIKDEINKVKIELLKQQKENSQKEEKNFLSLKDEINKMKSEFQKKQEENTKKEEDKMKSINEKMIKIEKELQNYQSENKNKVDQKSLIEELNQINSFLHRMQTSMIFENDICREEFNKIDGETQISLIDEMRSMTNDSTYENIENLLIYLSKENNLSKSKDSHSNYIYIPDNIDYEGDKTSNSKIGVGFALTEILFLNGKLQSNEFSNFIKNFSEFHIEIKYPSDNFDSIFDIVKSLKNNFKSKLKISIFITGVKKTDQKFHGNEDIDVVKIDSCVDEIISDSGDGSFENCSSLSQVFIPKSVTKIDNWAFYVCSSLKKVSLPSSVIEINNGVFSMCRSLSKLTIPPFVTEIKIKTIQDCSSLTQITIPSSVTKIGDEAFSGCSSLAQITIPSSVTSIGNSAFSGCSSLTQITISSSLNLQNTRLNRNVKIIHI